jgi:putative hemolysin
MFEMALVSSRKSRLEEKAKFGSKGAMDALHFLKEPEKILSAIQVGITLIGIITGAFGGIALAEDLVPFFAAIPSLSPYADTLAIVSVVGLVTYLSLIIGELVPKTLALNNAEAIAIVLSPGMKVVGAIVYPLVWFLSISTKFVLKIFNISNKNENLLTEEELKIILKQGSESGAIEKEESEIISEVMRFGDKHAYNIMTPRRETEWFDISLGPEEIVEIAKQTSFARLLICDKAIDNIKGIASVRDILSAYISNPEFELTHLIKAPIYIPDKAPAIKVLELFRESKNHFGVVVDEYGGMEGIITLHDLAENIMGDLPAITDAEGAKVVVREDGSFLVDGMMELHDLHVVLNIHTFFSEDEDEGDINTIGGLAMHKLEKIPTEGETFTVSGYRFEIMDMDGNRVDKVLVSRITP